MQLKITRQQTPARLPGPFCVVTLLVILCIALPARAQPMQYGIQNGALANASVGMPTAGTGLLNPANLGYLDAGRLSLRAVQAYGLTELRLGGTNLAIPVRTSTLMLNAFSMGFDAYRETHLQFGFALPLYFGSSRRFILAIRGAMKRLAIKTYGSASGYSLSFGTSVMLSPNVFFGAAALHFFQPDGPVVLPRTLTLGFAYHPFSAGWVMISLAQTEMYLPSLNLGIEGKLTSFLSLRYGFSTQPLKYALGAGIQLDSFSFDLAATHHDLLGWTPGVSIGLAFMRRKDAQRSVN